MLILSRYYQLHNTITSIVHIICSICMIAPITPSHHEELQDYVYHSLLLDYFFHKAKVLSCISIKVSIWI